VTQVLAARTLGPFESPSSAGSRRKFRQLKQTLWLKHGSTRGAEDPSERGDSDAECVLQREVSDADVTKQGSEGPDGFYVSLKRLMLVPG
jgi:hypothetical protein